MNKLWRIAAYEYRRNVFKKSFIFTLLSIPFFIAISLTMGFLMESLRNKSQPVGIVDLAGIINEANIPGEARERWLADQRDDIPFVPYQGEDQALSALEAGEIQAYYILPDDYLETRRVEMVYTKEPGENTWAQFWDYLQLNLMAGQPAQVAYRAVSGADFIVRSLDGKREVPSGGPTFGLLMPLFIALAFMFMLIMSSGYILSAVADEKENRTMEVLVTTVSPLQLIGGKILGIVAISMTLLASWSGVVLLGVFTGRQFGVSWLDNLTLDWRSVVSILVIAIPAYILSTALMVAIGVSVNTTQEGQSVSTIFFILHAIPLYVSWFFLNEPHNSLAVLLSLLPFTSLMTVGMRNLFTVVPAWQVAASVAIQVITAVGAIWLAAWAFRTGMLRYGQTLRLRWSFKAR